MKTNIIIIELDEMSQNGIEYMETMLEKEIADNNGTIANENIWMIGSATEEQVFMHEQNIEELTEYGEYLQYLLNKINGNADEVIINLDELDEMHCCWIEMMFENELKAINGDIDNNTIWYGEKSRNLIELKQYKQIIKKIYDDIAEYNKGEQK